MRITLLANRDLASCVALNYLLPALAEHELTLFLSARVGKGDDAPRELQELKFFEQTLFTELLFPALDRGDPASGELRTFHGLGELLAQPLGELNAINGGADLARFVQTRPELVLSIRYGVILREQVIATPPLGVLNLHSGLLPHYKGVMATFRALLNGDAHIGTTLHFIDDASIDTGPVVTTTALAVEPDRSYLWHVLALYEEGCRVLGEAVAQLARGGKLAVQAQQPGGEYYSFPNEAELARFREMGHRLVDLDEIRRLALRFLPAG